METDFILCEIQKYVLHIVRKKGVQFFLNKTKVMTTNNIFVNLRF